MTSDGSPYARLQRAIRSGNLPLIHATAAELGWVPLRDALAILLVIDAKDEARFDRRRCGGPAGWRSRSGTSSWPGGRRAAVVVALPDEHAQRSLLALTARAVGPPGARRRRRRCGVRSRAAGAACRSRRYRAPTAGFPHRSPNGSRTDRSSSAAKSGELLAGTRSSLAARSAMSVAAGAGKLQQQQQGKADQGGRHSELRSVGETCQPHAVSRAPTVINGRPPPPLNRASCAATSRCTPPDMSLARTSDRSPKARRLSLALCLP